MDPAADTARRLGAALGGTLGPAWPEANRGPREPWPWRRRLQERLKRPLRSDIVTAHVEGQAALSLAVGLAGLPDPAGLVEEAAEDRGPVLRAHEPFFETPEEGFMLDPSRILRLLRVDGVFSRR